MESAHVGTKDTGFQLFIPGNNNTMSCMYDLISAVNCGDPITNLNVNLEYSSTLFGSQLLFWCENAKNVTTAQCSENAIWMPDPTELVCSPSSTSTAIPTLTSNHVLRDTCTYVACPQTITI